MTPCHDEAMRALRIADRDIVAFRKMSGDPDFHFATTCFHAQQGIEKCMKAVMFEREILFPPIHDLVRLVLVLHEHGISVPCSVDDLRKLNPFAVTFRYDDTDIPLISIAEVGAMVVAIRNWAGEQVK